MNSRTSNLYIGNPNQSATDQALSVDATAGGVQFSAFHADTDYVVIDVQTDDVRVTFDGSAPTSSNGHILGDAQGLIVLSKNAAEAAKFIRITNTAVVHASEFID